MKKVAIITARSGSKGLPHKNVLPLEGKPVLAYSIEAALESGCFEKIVLTTDSQEYIDLFSHYPIEFIHRKAELATDKATSFSALADALVNYGYGDYDYFVQLQPTSPLRTARHIQEVCTLFEEQFNHYDYLVSVYKSHKPTVLIHLIDEDKTMKYFDIDYSTYRRQDFPQEYSPNGAFFVAKPKEYLEQKHFYGARSLSYEMDEESSIDVDSQVDLDQIALILRRRHTDFHTERIEKSIYNKTPLCSQQATITLIGDSLASELRIDSLGDKDLINLGIEDITPKEYCSRLFESGKIKTLGRYTLLLFNLGAMSIREADDFAPIVSEYERLIDNCRKLNPQTTILVGSIPPSSFTVHRDNLAIQKLNQRLISSLSSVIWIDLYAPLVDKYNKLQPQLGLDGVSLNTRGYQCLQGILTAAFTE